MARYYDGREIRIGDRAEVIREQEGRALTGMRCTVVTLDSCGYDCGVEFDEDMGGHSLHGELPSGSRRGYFMFGNRLKYIGDAVAESDNGKTRCSVCRREIAKTTRLGVRLFKDTPICDECVIKRIGRVNSYHTGKLLAYAYAKDKITLGCEIEIDDCDEYGDRDAVIEGVIDTARENNFALIMSHESDGSLNYDGFESVTAPLSIDEWKSDEVQAQLVALFDGAEENGFTLNEGSAGLHVHIGRKDLCGTDRRKSDAVGLLMGWAVARLWDQGFRKLSRRSCTDYCHLYNERGRGTNGLYDTDAYEGDRYTAVNLENNATIELRIFKGARCTSDVLVAVDVCYMLAKWATKKINAFAKRTSYSAHAGKYDDALAYADRISWDALVKYSKFPEVTLPAMREAGINI